MKQVRYIVPLMLFIALAIGQTTFAESGSKSGKLHGWYAKYAKDLKMTDEQVEKYKQIIDTKQTAEKQWNAENVQAYKQAKEAYTAAKKSGDKKAIKTAKEVYNASKKGKYTAGNAFNKAFAELLTDEQKGTYEGVKLASSANWYLKKAGATQAQQAKVKELALIEGAKLAELKASGKKAYNKAKHEFKMKIVDEVLTEEQKATLHAGKPAKKVKASKSEKKKDK